MKRSFTFLASIFLAVGLTACGGEKTENISSTEAETKKALPVKTEAATEEAGSGHYKQNMIPFEELVPSERIVVLQNTVNFTREGFYTEETKPQAEGIVVEGEEHRGYPMSLALSYLTNGYEAGVSLVTTNGEETEFSAEEIDSFYVIIDDFKDLDAPDLYDPEKESLIKDFDHLMTKEGEMVISVLPEQDLRFVDIFALAGFDCESTSYHVMATDKFFIPVGPEDYDDGELRGGLSGSVNGTFPDLAIAQGKINDVIYIERIVE